MFDSVRNDNDMLKEMIGKIDSCGVVLWFLMLDFKF